MYKYNSSTCCHLCTGGESRVHSCVPSYPFRITAALRNRARKINEERTKKESCADFPRASTQPASQPASQPARQPARPAVDLSLSPFPLQLRAPASIATFSPPTWPPLPTWVSWAQSNRRPTTGSCACTTAPSSWPRRAPKRAAATSAT